MESNDNKCVICYETITNSVKLECNHIFCLKCIFLSSKNNNDIVKCSLCRKIINFDNEIKRNVFTPRIENNIRFNGHNEHLIQLGYLCFCNNCQNEREQREINRENHEFNIQNGNLCYCNNCKYERLRRERESQELNRERERQQISHEYRTINNMFCFCISCHNVRQRRQDQHEIIKNIFQQIKNNKKKLRGFGEYRSFKNIEKEYYDAYITSINRYNGRGKTNDRNLRSDDRSEQALLYSRELISRQEKYINDVPMIQLKRKEKKEIHHQKRIENINKSLNKIISQNDIINY